MQTIESGQKESFEAFRQKCLVCVRIGMSFMVHRDASLEVLADSIRFALTSREWSTSEKWFVFEEQFVLSVFRSVAISENDRQHILRAARAVPSARVFRSNHQALTAHKQNRRLRC